MLGSVGRFPVTKIIAAGPQKHSHRYEDPAPVEPTAPIIALIIMSLGSGQWAGIQRAGSCIG